MFRIILNRVFIGIVVYICFIQPNVWEYTLETFSPYYSTIERTVSAKGVVLCREEVIYSPLSGIMMKVKNDLTRVSKGDTIAIIFPTLEDYKSYIEEVNSVRSYYDNTIKEKSNAIANKKLEMEKVYSDLSKESELLNSLIVNKQDIADALAKINELNARINSLKDEIKALTKDVEMLKEEKLRRLADLKQSAVSSNTKVTSDSSGLISFSIDGREDIRNTLIEKGIQNNVNIESLLKDSKVISDGTLVKKGDAIAKVIDNLEQFVLLDVSLDGKSPIAHNSYQLNIDGKDVNIEFVKWIDKYPKELWLCKVKTHYYIGPKYISLNIKVGTIEGLIVPRYLIKQEEGRFFVYIVGSNSVEKKFIEVLGGNEKEVVIDNITEEDLLFVD